jgi:5-methylcytosine-specific restriction endonuclease McrA
MAKRPTDAQRKEVFARAKGLCEYCLSPEKYSNSTFEIEHILPIFHGGETVLTNLALSCSGCNKYKARRTEGFDAVTGKMTALFNPRRDVWKKHFEWNADFTRIIGLTAKARATISVLKLNRKNLINLRKVLRLFGEYPPE